MWAMTLWEVVTLGHSQTLWELVCYARTIIPGMEFRFLMNPLSPQTYKLVFLSSSHFPVPLCLSVFLCISLPLSLYLYVCLSLSLSLYLPLSSFYLPPCLSLSVSVCLFLCLFVFSLLTSLSFFVPQLSSVSLYLHLFFSLYLSL